MKRLAHYIERPASIITSADNLEPLYTFKDFPVFMGCIKSSQEDDVVADMEWGICKDTGIIQLKRLIPHDILYAEQHNDGIGAIWTEHYDEFCRFLKKYSPHNVLEIGGAQGIIAKNFVSMSPQTNWTIVEPNPTFHGNEHIRVIKAWFDDRFSFSQDVDTIVHSHVLEHTYDPAAYLRHISQFLDKGKKHIFSFPNMLEQLQRKYTNCLNFEHTIFLTEYFMDYLLEKNGFTILEKKYFKDHSIFYATEKASPAGHASLPESKYDEHRGLFMDFVNYHLEMVKGLNKKDEAAQEPTYLFGAHIFSQYLIQFGLKTNKIICILDNSPLKQGKRLYGTSLMVKSPKILQDKGRANVILKAGIYNDEIKKDILENINKEVVFW